MRYTGVLATLAILLVVTAGQSVTDCDISDPAALSRCIKLLLQQQDVRNKIRLEADPLRLPNHHDDDLTATDIVIRGLASYNVNSVSVTFPAQQKIAVRAAISWTSITAKLDVKLRKCKRVLFINLCAKVDAEPHARVGHTSGTLTTTLTVHIGTSGQLTVSSSDTNVSLSLPGISVTANVRGFIGLVNKLFGDPASRIATKLTNKWWRENKGIAEREGRKALDKAIRENVSANLARLAHF